MHSILQIPYRIHFNIPLTYCNMLVEREMCTLYIVILLYTAVQYSVTVILDDMFIPVQNVKRDTRDKLYRLRKCLKRYHNNALMDIVPTFTFSLQLFSLKSSFPSSTLPSVVK